MRITQIAAAAALVLSLGAAQAAVVNHTDYTNPLAGAGVTTLYNSNVSDVSNLSLSGNFTTKNTGAHN
jgi:hypothetical protein